LGIDVLRVSSLAGIYSDALTVVVICSFWRTFLSVVGI